MNIKKGDMVSIKQDFIDRNNRYEYDSRDIWEVKEVYKIGGGYHVAVINNLTGYLRPLVWEFDNGRATACGCGTDCYSHWSVQAESIMSVIKRSDNGKSAEAYDIDELKNNWNHWVRTGEILFTPGNGRW